MNKNNKGVILGITVVSLLILLLLVSATFSVIVSKQSFYNKQNDKIIERLNLNKYGQELYINLLNDIKEENNITSYEIFGQTINVNIKSDDNNNDYYEYIVEGERLTLIVKISITGEIIAWKIT